MVVQSDIAAGDRIKARLQAAFAPDSIEVIDESHKHASHAHAMKPPGAAARPGGTHFHVKLVSEAFKGKSLVERHRRPHVGVAVGAPRPVLPRLGARILRRLRNGGERPHPTTGAGVEWISG
jgi:BolA protein